MNTITSERIALIRQIHEAAKAKKLSLSDLSELTEETGRRIPPAELSRAFVHPGNFRIETLIRLAHAAGCRVRIEKDDKEHSLFKQKCYSKKCVYNVSSICKCSTVGSVCQSHVV